jgi:hypothetical protein
MGFTYKLPRLFPPYKFIHPSTTSFATPLSKIRPRQVVDIDEANPTLLKILKSTYFLMSKRVPNVSP